MATAARVCIIGGGIAGLACSISLSRKGLRCEVFERADSKEGASVGFTGRATTALTDLGIYDDVLKAGREFDFESGVSAMRDPTGKILGLGPKPPSTPDIKNGVGVYRPTLIDVLTKTATEFGVRIHSLTTYSRIDNRPDGVSVDFTNGGRGEYDFLIGADGIGSEIRQEFFPDSASPEYTGQMSIRFMAPGPHVEGEGLYNTPEGRFSFYSVPEGVYVPSVFNMPENATMSQDEAYAQFSRMLEHCTAPGPVELRRRLSPGSNLIARPFRWILVPQPWYRDRVILVGDAAHAPTPHLGMGAAMALEDAVVLAESIGDAGSYEEGFKAFGNRRFTRVKTVVHAGMEIAKMQRMGVPLAARMKLLAETWAELGEPY